MKKAIAIIALMMEAARTCGTLVNFYQTIRRYNPEDSHLLTHRRENLKSYLQKNDLETFPRLSPWKIFLLEKLAVVQLVKKFPVFYGTRLSLARHWTLH
jgi:NADH pyrophosphatase NudC (nudix superfamily)